MADEFEDRMPPIAYQQTRPSGVMPRQVTQILLWVGGGVLVLGVLVFLTRPAATARPERVVTPDRAPTVRRPPPVRDDPDRLMPAPAAPDRTRSAPASRASAPVDPLEADRKRKDYESLFASNVVASRRTGTDAPVGTAATSDRRTAGAATADRSQSLDDIASAVVRASQRGTPNQPMALPGIGGDGATGARRSGGMDGGGTAGAAATPPIDATGPTHTVLEGTVLEAVLRNRLDGSTASPVKLMLTTPLYSHNRQFVLLPAGAELLGETKPVTQAGEDRLAVTFHRLILPDGSTRPLHGFKGLGQAGDSGLKDQVNRHLASTIGLSAVVGLVTGLSQSIGANGIGGREDGNNNTHVVVGDVTQTTARAVETTLNRGLNRPWTITIREAVRVRVWTTEDLQLPVWETP